MLFLAFEKLVNATGRVPLLTRAGFLSLTPLCIDCEANYSTPRIMADRTVRVKYQRKGRKQAVSHTSGEKQENRVKSEIEPDSQSPKVYLLRVNAQLTLPDLEC